MSLSDVATVIGLQPVVKAADPAVPVRGACLVEGPDMVDQIEPGWLVITEGTNVAGASESDLRDLLRSMRDKGACGVVIKLGRIWKQPPSALVDEAVHAAVPLFTMSGETSVGYFLRYVHEAAGIEDLAVLSRALSIQTDLLDALAYPVVEAELIRRVSDSLGISAVLYGSDLTVLASQGTAPVHLIADAIRQQASGLLTLGRWKVSAAPIETIDSSYWLAFAWQATEEPSGEILRSSRRAIEQLLRAHGKTVSANRAQEYIQRARLVNELMAGVDEARLEQLRDQLVLLHFPREATFQVHVMRPVDEEDSWVDSNNRLAATVLDLADAHDACVLLGMYEGEFVVLHTGREGFTRHLVDVSPKYSHGASATFTDLSKSTEAFRQATVSLAAGARQRSFTPFYQVGFAEFVLGHVPPDELRLKADQVIAGLAEYPAAIETLVSFLRNRMDVQSTGNAMHLHPNSIRYRLAKIEEILGEPLNDPETITVLYLSLHDLIRQDELRHRSLRNEQLSVVLLRDAQ